MNAAQVPVNPFAAVAAVVLGVVGEVLGNRTVITAAQALACQSFFYTSKAHKLSSRDKKGWLETMMKIVPFDALSLTQLQRQLINYNRGVDARKKTATKMHSLVKDMIQQSTFVDKYALFILAKLYYIWQRSSVIPMSNTRVQACPTL